MKFCATWAGISTSWPGPFDQHLLDSRQCAALELSREPVRCALSIYHPPSRKREAESGGPARGDLFDDPPGAGTAIWTRCGMNCGGDHPEIHIVDFDFLSINIFNQCENSNDIMMTIDNWKNIHPLLKTLPVDWGLHHPLRHLPRPPALRHGEAVPASGKGGAGTLTRASELLQKGSYCITFRDFSGGLDFFYNKCRSKSSPSRRRMEGIR